MYAIVAAEEKNIEVIHDFVNSLGENTTRDMPVVEDVVDYMNVEENCRRYLGFGISPRSATTCSRGVCQRRTSCMVCVPWLTFASRFVQRSGAMQLPLFSPGSFLWASRESLGVWA